MTKYRKGLQGIAKERNKDRKGSQSGMIKYRKGLQKRKIPQRTFNKKKIAKMLHFSAAFCCKRLLQPCTTVKRCRTVTTWT